MIGISAALAPLMTRLVIAVGVALSMVACTGKELTQVVVVFSADEAVSERATRMRISVYSLDSDELVYDAPFRLAGAGADAAFPVRLPMTPAGGDASRKYRVVASLFDADATETAFAQVSAVAGYVPHQTRTLRLHFEDACADVLCDDGLTCWEGACRGACFDASAPDEGSAGPLCGSCETCFAGTCVSREDGAFCSVEGHICEAGACSDQGPFPACGRSPTAAFEAATLGLYRMEMADVAAGVLKDEIPTTKTRTARNGTTTGKTRPGPDGCGTALETGEGGYALLFDDRDGDPQSDWSLENGAFELLLSLDALPVEPDDRAWGIVTRELVGDDPPGQMGLYVNHDGRLYVTVKIGTGAETVARSVCAAQPLPAGDGSWHRVGVNFGVQGIELVVDGVPANGNGSVSNPVNADLACGASIADTSTALGSNVPWLIGADQSTSIAPSHFLRGAIDELRFYGERRNFSPSP
ncbi:MAG: hypothetical protein KC417_07455 [Myxococcales bacterium]|nr:hypothetical protein [Myxococcales bacterium]